MESMEMEESMRLGMSFIPDGSHYLQFTIDILAAVVGLFAVLMVIRLNRKLGGKISQGLRFFIAGVFCNILAIVWSVFYGHILTFGGTNLDVHQNLMSLGMVLFIISTAKFAKLVQ